MAYHGILPEHEAPLTPTLVASCWAPHVGRPENERLEFWTHLDATLTSLRQRFPTADAVLAGDATVWWPDLIANRSHPADNLVVLCIRAILQRHKLRIRNPHNTPTHVQAGVLDLILASPAANVSDITVHDESCCFANAPDCCPSRNSDHFLLTVQIDKTNEQPNPDASCRWHYVADWEQILQKA